MGFTGESRINYPVVISAREIALPEAKPLTHWVRFPDHIEAHCYLRVGCYSSSRLGFSVANNNQLYAVATTVCFNMVLQHGKKPKTKWRNRIGTTVPEACQSDSLSLRILTPTSLGNTILKHIGDQGREPRGI